MKSPKYWAVLNYGLVGTFLAAISAAAYSAPTIYTNEAAYLAELANLEGLTIHESFENDAVWAESRNFVSTPGRTPSITSQGIVWKSNYSQNQIATGTVGGGAPDGAFAIYSLPHGMTTDSGLYCDSTEDPAIPLECFQNDGLRVESATGDQLFAFGGRIDTANSGKITFLLDGFDINGNDNDNLDNWQREGDPTDNWAFIGVIDANGFLSAEIRELRGKDYQQVLLFSDDFTIHTSTLLAEIGDLNTDGAVDAADAAILFINWGTVPPADPIADVNGDDVVDAADASVVFTKWTGDNVTAVPEPLTEGLLLFGLVGLALRRRVFVS